jgi:hypothetical protein
MRGAWWRRPLPPKFCSLGVVGGVEGVVGVEGVEGVGGGVALPPAPRAPTLPLPSPRLPGGGGGVA